MRLRRIGTIGISKPETPSAAVPWIAWNLTPDEKEGLLSLLERKGLAAGRTTGDSARFLADPEALESLLSFHPFKVDPSTLEKAVRGPDHGRFLRTWGLSPPGGGVALLGVLNVTPDSFFDGGRFVETEAAVRHAEDLAREGADIIDVGGESTRPGAETVPEEEEIRRVVPVIRELGTRLTIPISIDTRKAAVAEAAARAGAAVINDVTGLGHDPDLAKVAAAHGSGLILNHIRGTPRDMQKNPRYNDPVSEVYDDLARSAETAASAGVPEEKIAVDPGIGFGKRLSDNLLLLRHLSELRSLGFPVLVGASRKSFLGQILGLPVEERLEGTIGACAAAVLAGADMLRVHEPLPVSRAVRVVEAIRRGEA
ncbi:MAG: dihydropteroate synthase [Candidatus Eisenbacteria bacterium]